MTFVNTVNAYDKKEEAMEEMKQLASFAKHHVPEDHEKDSPQHAAVRAHKLLKNGGCAALVSLTLSESALLTDSIKELIARSVLAMSHRSEDRGLLIQQGTSPALDIKDSPDTSHFIHEINVGKRRIRYTTTLKLNDEFRDRLKID